MQMVTLKIDDNISDKFLWLLHHFNQNEIEVIEHTTYKSDDEYIKSIKGLEESIIEASNEKIENYVTREELEW